MAFKVEMQILRRPFFPFVEAPSVSFNLHVLPVLALDVAWVPVCVSLHLKEHSGRMRWVKSKLFPSAVWTVVHEFVLQQNNY